jgi:hypothetical protein
MANYLSRTKLMSVWFPTLAVVLAYSVVGSSVAESLCRDSPPGSSRAAAPASTYAFALPSIDSGWLDQHQRVPPPGPEPAQKQPKKQPVSGRKRLFERARTPSWWRRARVSSRRSRRVAPAPVQMTARITS